jgi:hypothetical protein
MSDIKRLIKDNERLIDNFKETKKKYNDEITSLQQSLIAESSTNNKEATKQQIGLRKKHIESLNRNINYIKSTNKQLQSKEKSNDPLRRIYQPRNVMSDEEAERELEELMRQNKFEEQENRRPQQISSTPPPIVDSKASTPDLIEEKEEKQNITPSLISSTPEPIEEDILPYIQQQNLAEREKAYEEKTGKKYNPLVTDDEENVDLSVPTPPLVAPSPPSSSSNISTKTTPDIPNPVEMNANPVNNTTRKNRNTPVEVEMKEFSKKRIINTRKIGFRETLKRKGETPKKPRKIDKNICQNIFMNGSKVNKAHFFPSQLPKITKIRPITVSLKRGGKRKTRKYVNRYKL